MHVYVYTHTEVHIFLYTYKCTYSGLRKRILNNFCPVLISQLNNKDRFLGKKEQSSPGTGISENENVGRLKTERGN